MTEFLLRKGANVNATNKNHGTPLHLAAFVGHLEIVKLLAENGADLNAANKDEIPAISYAVTYRYQCCQL